MPTSSRRWTRLARAAALAVVSTTAVVALTPSAANAAPEAIVTAPGCSTTALPGAHFVTAGSTLGFTISARGSQSSSVLVSDQGYLNLGGGPVSVFEGHLRTDPQSMPVTYGTTTFDGRSAFCATWTGVNTYDSPGAGTFDAQVLVVNRSDIQAGDFDLVYNFGRIGGNPAGARAAWALGGPDGQDQFSFPGSGAPGGLVDGSPTAVASGSRESSVPGRYVFRFRNGALVTTPAPDTTIETGPTGRTATDPAFTWTGTGAEDDTLTYECRVTATGETAGAFTTCPASGTSYADLADGAWTFEVRAVGALGGSDNTPASRTFTVDTTGPAVAFDTTPDTPSNDNTPTFTWSSTDADATSYQCLLTRNPSPEPSPWESCTSGEELVNLGDGDWTYTVRGADDLGNTGSTDSFDFTIDTSGPETTFDTTPVAVGNDTTPTFTFSTDEEDATFECMLSRNPAGEPSPWEECASGEELTNLGDGDWTYTVRALDALGNAGPEVSYDFTIDTGRPSLALTSTPKALGNDSTPSFAWTSDDQDIAGYQCVVVAEGAQSASPTPCAATGFTSGALADGSYRFVVVATDGAGNDSEPASYAFTVDTTAPQASLVDPPAAVVTTGSATFGFTADGQTTFECRLVPAGQSADWQPCAGTSKTVTGLADGTYTFEVRATDAAGNTSAAVSRTFKVNLGQPTITATVVSDRPASKAGWYRGEVTITYTCNGNGSALVGACPAPREVPRAQQGRITFRASIATADGDTASVSTLLYIDKGKPKARIKGFSGKRSYTSVPKDIRCVASDPRSGLAGCTVKTTKVTRKNGDRFIVVRATAVDEAGNVRVVTKKAPLRAA
jgi:hypothetical protein